MNSLLDIKHQNNKENIYNIRDSFDWKIFFKIMFGEIMVGVNISPNIEGKINFGRNTSKNIDIYKISIINSFYL